MAILSIIPQILGKDEPEEVQEVQEVNLVEVLEKFIEVKVALILMDEERCAQIKKEYGMKTVPNSDEIPSVVEKMPTSRENNSSPRMETYI